MPPTDVVVSDIELRYNDAPFSASTTDNWVARKGGLPPYVRAVARGLMKSGSAATESEAIQMAIGVIKRWAKGGSTYGHKSHASPATIAKAAEAVAHWEAMKASTGRSEEDLILRAAEEHELTRAAAGPAGSQNQKAAAAGAKTTAAKQPAKGTPNAYAAGHPFHGNQHTKVAGQQGIAVGGKGSSTKAMGKPSKGGAGGKGGAAGAASKAAAAAAAQTAKNNAVDTARNSYDTAKLAQAKAQAQLAAATTQAAHDIAFAESKLTNTTAGVQGTQNLDSVKTAAAARIQSAQSALDSANLHLTQTQGQVEKAMKAAGYRGDSIPLTTRDGFLGETTGNGADKLLPVGPTKKQGDDIHDEMAAHRFKGSDLKHCTDCGKAVTAKVHKKTPGQPIPPVPREATTRSEETAKARAHLAAASTQNQRHMDSAIPTVDGAMRALFADQRKQTLYRITGKRGKNTLKRCAEELQRLDQGLHEVTRNSGVTRADGDPNEPPIIPPEDTGTEVPAAPPSVSAAGIFDVGFWAERMSQVLQPHLQAVGTTAAGAVRGQLRLDPMADDTTSLGHLSDVMAQRAAAAANYVTGVTAKNLAAALQQGVANGEGIPAISKRINDVFDSADLVRARRIAQTEVVGAYNEGAHAYAEALPGDVLGTRRWLAHHDDHTRPTHRMADGQEQPMGAPFYVGGSPMAYPGDKSAPVGEWINCRCSVGYLPPGMGYDAIAAEAQKYVDGLRPVVPAA